MGKRYTFIEKTLNKETLEDDMVKSHLNLPVFCYHHNRFHRIFPSPCHNPPFCRKYGIFPTRYCPIIMDQDDHISKFEDVSQDGGVVSHYTPTIFSSTGFVGNPYFWGLQRGTVLFDPSIKIARRQSSSKSRPCTSDKFHILRDSPFRNWMTSSPEKGFYRGPVFQRKWNHRGYSLVFRGVHFKTKILNQNLCCFFKKPPLTNNHHHPTSK